MKNELILASKSPRRYELLKQLGFSFDIVPSTVSEEVLGKEPPGEHVSRLAEAKALDVGGRYPDRWVIAADTIVYIEGSILGKPKDRAEAIEMLSRLSGREHRVWSGISVCHLGGGKKERRMVETAVKMKSLTPAEMKWYVRTGEPLDKAGAYAIQGIGAFMIESIRGSYTNVVGLPMCELIEMLDRVGALEISESGFRIVK
jgi:septum formation protein